MSQAASSQPTVEPKRVTKPQVWRGRLKGLQRLMRKGNLTDKTLGAMVQRSARTVQSWRVGEAAPTGKMLEILAEALSTTVSDLFIE